MLSPQFLTLAWTLIALGGLVPTLLTVRECLRDNRQTIATQDPRDRVIRILALRAAVAWTVMLSTFVLIGLLSATVIPAGFVATARVVGLFLLEIVVVLVTFRYRRERTHGRA